MFGTVDKSKETRSLSRTARRLSVIALFAGLGAGAGLMVAGNITGSLALTLAAVPAYLLAAIAIGLLFTRTRYWRWGNAPDADLDEFELQLRNRAYVHAYATIATLTFLGWVYWDFATDLGLWLPPSEGGIGAVLMWSYFLFILKLPAALVAWADTDD